MTKRLLMLVAVLALCGCAKKVEVRSDSCWDGVVGGANVDGCGNRTYTIKGDTNCATFTLKDSGYVQARIKGKAWVTTNARYGSVTVCD